MPGLEELVGAEEAARLKALWDATTPAPDNSQWPDWITWAHDACQDIAGYSIECCEIEDLKQIYVAALDAEPQGKDAVRRAAIARLEELAVADGWDDCLYGRLDLD